MSRPEFLTAPGTWVRSPRVDETPAQYASAIHHTSKGDAAAGVVLAIVIGICLALVLVHWAAS